MTNDRDNSRTWHRADDTDRNNEAPSQAWDARAWLAANGITPASRQDKKYADERSGGRKDDEDRRDRRKPGEHGRDGSRPRNDDRRAGGDRRDRDDSRSNRTRDDRDGAYRRSPRDDDRPAPNREERRRMIQEQQNRRFGKKRPETNVADFDRDDFERPEAEFDSFDDAYENDSETKYQPVPNPCPVADRCGGCEWLSMPYEMQLERKQDFIEELFANARVEVDPIVGMKFPDHYRNKVQLPFAPGTPNSQGRMTARWGIFERGTHRIVNCSECYVEDEAARPIIHTVAKLLPEFDIKPYDERSGKGVLRYCLVRTARVTDQIMLTLICNANRLPHEDEFLDRLLAKHPEITTVVLNENTDRTSVILGTEERVLVGPGYIEDRLCGCTFRISSSSFYQTNPYQAERLYDIAVELAGVRAGDRIGDAYCGTGTIGIVAAKKTGAKLLGVERNADAVEDARVNAQINGIEDAEFVVGDAGSVFARMARAGESLDVVFMDPPRSGSNQAFLANLCRLNPRRVVYISCEPRTQKNDIFHLTRNGYRIKRICPVDMFPHTDHVENIILLERPQIKLGNRRGGKSGGKDRRDYRCGPKAE